VNSAIEECTVSNIGIVVMDELHMLDDDHRGYLMEIMATKLLSLEQSIQVIGMSATISVSLRPIWVEFIRTGVMTVSLQLVEY
jgi:superfamily II helicase